MYVIRHLRWIHLVGLLVGVLMGVSMGVPEGRVCCDSLPSALLHFADVTQLDAPCRLVGGARGWGWGVG